jgi:intracellular septation protein
MQLLFDLIPLLAFFVAYKFGGIFVATAVVIAAVVVQTFIQWITRRKVSPMLLTSATLVLIFGGLTLIFKDALFIKVKPTILYWLFAGAFAASQVVSRKPLLQLVLNEGGINVEHAVWTRANLLFAAFFFAMGAANLYVAFNYTEQAWVYFKFALFGALAVFTFGVTFWLVSKMPPEPSGDAPETKNP